jgi:hypothetical protein
VLCTAQSSAKDELDIEHLPHDGAAHIAMVSEVCHSTARRGQPRRHITGVYTGPCYGDTSGLAFLGRMRQLRRDGDNERDSFLGA